MAEVMREIERNEEEENWEMEIPAWNKQITIRGLIASAVIGVIYCVITMRLSLTTGLSMNLNVSVALLAFIFLQSWSKIFQKLSFSSVPFTKQENTMIQTCAVACYSIAISGGFGSYLLALNKKTYELAGVNTPGNSARSHMELELGWVIAYNFLVCSGGLFVLIPLRKILIVGYNLPFPTGLATAVLINGFHSKGDKQAREQVRGFLKYFSMSFLWGFFQWFFNGKSGDCGFSQFPTFGLQAWKQSFYFDFSLTYVGTGMICSHLVSLSLLLGAVISWGIMWPVIGKLKGDWFPADLPGYSMQGLNGYKVFISIALILGDGLYIFIKIICIIIKNFHDRGENKTINADDNQIKAPILQKQNEVFVKETIPMWITFAGYIPLSIISTILISIKFPQIKWYYVIVAYILSPVLSFANAYGAGLTDQNIAYNYGKLAIFILAALAGEDNGVVAGLVGSGIIKSVAFVSCSLMQDFKTGHMTLSSPRSMLLSQAVGTAIGCIAASLVFFLFYHAFDVGNPSGEYKAPYALIYRNMAILGVEGFSALPRHCLELCYAFFALALVLNLLRDLLPSKIGKFMPLPMVMAVPFLVGGYFAIDMCVGSLIVFGWHRLNPKTAGFMIPVVASGFICGEGLWSLPASLLALAKVYPPICMKFLAS